MLKFSLELFPPKNLNDDFWQTLAFFVSTNPDFISITCNAGGTGSDDISNIALALVQEHKFTSVAAHMVCLQRNATHLKALAQKYSDIGIKHIVALRGDSPPLDNTGCVDGFQHADELVAMLREDATTNWDISVAGYPEVHPDSASAEQDVEYTCRKIASGANRILTQFFFNTDSFLHFRDKLVASGVTIPIVPGILPITHFDNMRSFAVKCGAHVPKQLSLLLEDIEKTDPAGHDQLAFAFLISQIEKLRSEGVENFHFYTLNKTRILYLLMIWLKSCQG